MDPRLQVPKPFRGIVSGIGALCHEWARLEDTVCQALIWAAKINAGRASRAIVRCFDFRDQLSALKLALVARLKDQAALEALIEAIDYIDNTLRLRRNRYIHDAWYLGSVTPRSPIRVYRAAMAAKILKPQARQARVWRWQDFHTEDKNEVVWTVQEVRDHLLFIEQVVAHCQARNAPALKALLARPPQRRFPLPQQGTPSQKGNAIAKRKPPQKSSRGRSQ